MSEPVSSAEFWNGLYLSGDTGWDKGRPAPPITRLVGERVVSPGRIAVIGAGKGYEAVELASHGFAVTAIDFAEQACAALRKSTEARGVGMTVLQADLFDLPRTHAGRFDAVLEHTCFCAIDPTRRAEYVDAVSALLVPGGTLFGLFYAHARPGGPPFATTEAEIRERFSDRYDLERLIRAQDSFPERAGDELEFVFRKR